MNWINFKLCFIVVISLMTYFAAADDNNNDEELLPMEQIIDAHDVPTTEAAERKVSPQSAKMPSSQSTVANINKNVGSNTGFQLGQGLIPASIFGLPQDAQAASASNKVVLVLNKDKNKFAEFANTAEKSLKRMTRNPDLMEDLAGHIQQLGGGVTQHLLQQVSQTAPDMSRSFGEALNEALTQTNLLAQVAPGSIDLGQLGQSLSQSFLLGATQNVLNQSTSETSSLGLNARTAEESGTQSVGAAGPEAESEPAQEPRLMDPQDLRNPLNQIVGNPLFPQFPRFNPAHPFGMLGPLYALSPLMPLGSEISEVRVLPEQHSPYKISPKPVDQQTIAEMKLKAVLKESLTKKTIPILWFHLPANHNLRKSGEDLATEAKLEIFEQQVIAELKQLQELSKMANEVKQAQLESGAEPTESLKTKLDLYEIPIYDITLGDMEKTLKDEHVKMLMQTIFQKQNKEFHRHHQATTKYLTDLTGAPIKRQAKTADDAQQTMENVDMEKMMAYAYRMAALNGHDMPWFKKATSSAEKDVTKTSKSGQEEMSAERKWLEDKQKQMAIEAQNQMQMFEDGQQRMAPDQLRYWSDPSMMHGQMPVQRQMKPLQVPVQSQMMPSQMQEQMPVQNQMMSAQMQQQMPAQKQMMDRPMQHDLSLKNEMMPPQMQQHVPFHQEMSSHGEQIQQHMPLQGETIPSEMQKQMPSQREMMSTQMQQQMPPQMQQQMPPQIRQQMPPQMRQQMPPQMQHQMPPQMRQQMPPQMQQQMPPQMQHQVPSQIRQQMPPQMQQQMPPQMQIIDPNMPAHYQDIRRQMMPPPMQPPIPLQREMIPSQMQMVDPNMPLQQHDIQGQMMQQQQMTNLNMQQQMPMQRHQQPPMMQSHMQQHHKEWNDASMPQAMRTAEQRQPVESKIPEQPPKALDKHEQQKEGNDTKTTENLAILDMHLDDVHSMGRSKPQMPENDGKARHKGIDDLFDNLNVLDFGKHKKIKPPPTIINYYYNAHRYPLHYGKYGNISPYHHYNPSSGHYGGGAYGSNAYGSPYGLYRTATGDEEIASMLQQHQHQHAPSSLHYV